MDCHWLLMCKTHGYHDEPPYHFHEDVPENADELARKIVAHLQEEQVGEMPFLPPIVTGILYREYKQIDGAEFLRRVKADGTTVPLDDEEAKKLRSSHADR